MAASVLTVIFTGVIALFTYFLWRLERRMTVFTGAMETHSFLMLRLEAERQKIKTVWWDKTVEPLPFDGRHKESAEVKEIKFAIPWVHRQHQPCWLVKVLRGYP